MMQVRSLCEKAKEILMQENNVQVFFFFFFFCAYCHFLEIVLSMTLFHDKLQDASVAF
jgi:hypothetical protein